MKFNVNINFNLNMNLIILTGVAMIVITKRRKKISKIFKDPVERIVVVTKNSTYQIP